MCCAHADARWSTKLRQKKAGCESTLASGLFYCHESLLFKLEADALMRNQSPVELQLKAA